MIRILRGLDLTDAGEAWNTFVEEPTTSSFLMGHSKSLALDRDP